MSQFKRCKIIRKIDINVLCYTEAEILTAKAAVAQRVTIFAPPQFADKARNPRTCCHDRFPPQEGSADQLSTWGGGLGWQVSLTFLSLIIWSGGKRGWQESHDERREHKAESRGSSEVLC